MEKKRFQNILLRLRGNKYVNKYTVTLAVFIVWMLFFDSNSLLERYDTYTRRREVDREIKYYHSEIERNKALLDALGSDTETLERFAREHYRMKKPDEDVYIIRE